MNFHMKIKRKKIIEIRFGLTKSQSHGIKLRESELFSNMDQE